MTTSIGARIREARQRRGFKQDGLALAAGISKGYLSDLENGKREPGAAIIIGLCDALDVSADWLLGRPSHLALADVLELAARDMEHAARRVRTLASRAPK